MNEPINNHLFIQQLDIARGSLAIIPAEDQLLKKIPSLLEPVILQTCRFFQLPIIDIVPVGSSQRQTYLPGNRDIDIFVRFDTRDHSLLENFASQVIPSLAQTLNTTFEIKYAENPYGVIHYMVPEFHEVISIDIVATIWINQSQLLTSILPLSGMARTPFHMFYLQQHIKGLEEEVRLFKYWAKQKKLYRQSGFTGFISELLIIIYGSFTNLLNKADEITSLTYDFHGRSLAKLRKKFSTYPMILIDPVDPDRNAAAGIHGILGSLHLNRFRLLAKKSISNPTTLWQEFLLNGNVFTLKITFTENIEVKNDDEYYSRIIKVLGLVFRALNDQQINLLDAIIDVDSSTLSFTTDSIGGNFLKVRGPPTHLTNHVIKFLETNHDSWMEEGIYWSRKQQLTVQDVVSQKINNPDLLRSLELI